ncbi:MAG: hypothetical protein ACJAT4_001889 [Granulosicoccus sp.]|jgi:hypothetical protein
MRSFIYLIFLGLIFSGCRSNDLIPYNSAQNIKILNIDFDKFEYQVVFKFVTKKTRKIGFFFIDNREEKALEFFKLRKGKFTAIDICQIPRIIADHNFYLNGANVCERMNDGFLENKYYTICHKQLNEIKNGL